MANPSRNTSLWVLSLVLLVTLASIQHAQAFSSLQLRNKAPKTSATGLPAAAAAVTDHASSSLGNILILDHLNLNHQKGRHDWLRAFYFDFLQCSVDPRKQENLDAGKKTVWANIGSNQFHLPEGKPDAQVLQGVVTLAYHPDDIDQLLSRVESVAAVLEGSKFACTKSSDGSLAVADPWGSRFRLVAGAADERDPRGKQPGPITKGLTMTDLTIYTPVDCNMAGIGRFYRDILGAPAQILDNDSDNDQPQCVVTVGPKQTLTFAPHPQGLDTVVHDDLWDEQFESPQGFPNFLSNYGPHVSMYVADLVGSYKKADALGLAYVNPRFSRRAFTLDEAIADCMFRCLNIVDPANPDAGVILKLEHEIRSVVKKDGSMYKSCPFDAIPEGVNAAN